MFFRLFLITFVVNVLACHPHDATYPAHQESHSINSRPSWNEAKVEQLESHDLMGRWACGDGLGYNVTLELNSDNKWNAMWAGCRGAYGEASGTWTFLDNRLHLYPLHETRLMEDYLRTLKPVAWKGFLVLTRTDQEFVPPGPMNAPCFMRPEELRRVRDNSIGMTARSRGVESANSSPAD